MNVKDSSSETSRCNSLQTTTCLPHPSSVTQVSMDVKDSSSKESHSNGLQTITRSPHLSSVAQASMDVNGSSSEDGHSNGLQTTIGTGLRTTTDGPCSAPTGSGMPSLPFPLPDTHTRLSISTCASHAHGPRQSQPTSAHSPSATAFSTGGAHAQHQNPAHAPPHASSPEAGTAAGPGATSEKGGSNGGPVVGAPKLSSFALLHPAAAGGMVPMHQPQHQQQQQLLQQSGPLLAGSDVAQVRKWPSGSR